MLFLIKKTFTIWKIGKIKLQKTPVPKIFRNLPSETLPSYNLKPYHRNTLGILFLNEFLITYNEILKHRELYTWEIRAPKKKLTIRNLVSYYIGKHIPYLNTLANL